MTQRQMEQLPAGALLAQRRNGKDISKAIILEPSRNGNILVAWSLTSNSWGWRWERTDAKFWSEKKRIA
jgi:hypothetical protein